jgi:UDPglucose 6-dehydrogenase
MSAIAVIGAGYVGLTTAACFTRLGHEVTCADIDADRIAMLERGECPILEHGLDDLLREGRDSGRLQFVLGAANAVGAVEFVYLCVPTPQSPNGAADLSYIEAAAREISPHLPAESIVVNKSTVPIGAVTFVEQVLDRSDVHIVSNPEFLREGTAVHDFLQPDRVVIGADDEEAAIRVAELYKGISAPIMVTDATSAETIKYASNAFLATKLSFVNGIAAICEAVGADANDVMLGMGYDARIGRQFLRPGPGWGGSCFPKDTRALLHMSDEAGYEFSLLRSALDANRLQFERVADKIRRLAGGSLDGATIGVWGLTFKAGTDDLRDSPALEVIAQLRDAGATVQAYDPAISHEVDGVELVDDPYAACEGAAVLVVLTEWDEFKWLDFDKVARTLARPAVVDARNLLDRNSLVRKGFEYDGVGRS